MNEVILESTLTCPECSYVKTETMSTGACQWFYECEQCHAVMKPKPGDCCVYCSFGSVSCPPIQESGKHWCKNLNSKLKSVQYLSFEFRTIYQMLIT